MNKLMLLVMSGCLSFGIYQMNFEGESSAGKPPKKRERISITRSVIESETSSQLVESEPVAEYPKVEVVDQEPEPVINEAFETALAEIEYLDEPALTEVLKSPEISVPQKEQLVSSSPLPDKTNLLGVLENLKAENQPTAIILPRPNPTSHFIYNREEVSQLTTSLLDPKVPFSEKETLAAKVVDATTEIVESFNIEALAAVMITPDDKIVFFEEHPELKALLPTDESGNIIGIRVDDNLVPMETVPVEIAPDENLAEAQASEIPVIGPSGEVEMMPILNEAYDLVVVPTTANGEVAGISTSELANELIAAPESEAPSEPIAEPKQVRGVVTKNGVVLLGDDVKGGGLTQVDETQIEVIQVGNGNKSKQP